MKSRNKTWMLWVVCLFSLFVGACTCSDHGDATVDASDEMSMPIDSGDDDVQTVDVVDANDTSDATPNEAGHDASSDGAEPLFCGGPPSASGGAADSMSCACERARGETECANPASVCIAAPKQPAAFGCHPPCATTAECSTGYTCVAAHCWILCDLVLDDCPSPDLVCSQYENPVTGTQHVCVPRAGYVAP